MQEWARPGAWLRAGVSKFLLLRGFGSFRTEGFGPRVQGLGFRV